MGSPSVRQNLPPASRVARTKTGTRSSCGRRILLNPCGSRLSPPPSGTARRCPDEPKADQKRTPAATSPPSTPHPSRLACVLHVGDLRVDVDAVARRAAAAARSPRPLAPTPHGRRDSRRSSLPIEPGDLAAERDHARAGERREVDDRIGSSSTARRQPVGEHEPALGVGVQDLDRLAVADLAGRRPA